MTDHEISDNTDEAVIDYALNICRAFVNNQTIQKEGIKSAFDHDTRKLLQYAARHKLIPIFYHTVCQRKSLFPDQIIEKLAQKSRHIALRNMAMFAEMKMVTETFAKEGISVCPYKGVVFAQLFYKSLSLRSSVDIDFAIRLEDIGKSQYIMSTLGYEESKGTFDQKSVKKSRAFYLDYPWYKVNAQGYKILVEFHLSPAHKALYVPSDFRDYLSKNSSDQLSDHHDFSRVEQALFILIHHGAVDNWGKLMQLIDLDQILKVLDDRELQEFIISCDKAHVRKFLDLGISLCERLFQKTYAVDKKYHISSALLNRIEEDCLHTRLAGKWSENRDKLKYHLALRDSRMDQIKTIRSLARFGIYKKLGV